MNEDITAKNRVYRQLRRSIIIGHRRPGERLNVPELTRTYGGGITPVRDALHMLGQEGLVTIRPRSGYFVTSVTLKGLRDLLEVREILELAVVERAAQRISPEALEQLGRVHAGYTGDDDESYDRYTDENRTFHYLLAQTAGNEELAVLVGRLHDRLARFMVLRHAGQTQAQSHARILAALAMRDASAARQALLDELNETRDAILDKVVQDEGAAWKITARK